MSLRSTMSLALIAMLLVIGALASVLAYEVALGEAGQFMDDQMRQLASIVDERTRPGAIGSLQEPEDRFAVTVWTGDDRGLVLSPPAAAAPRHALGFETVHVTREEWRSYARSEGDRTIVVSQRMSARREIATHSALEVAFPILASVPLACLIVFAVVARVLRPLTRFGAELEAGEIGPLAGMRVERLPAELRPFGAAIAGLVGRLQGALDRQRRFVADAAHQLRTPIAAVRLQIDNLSAAGLDDGGRAPLAEGMRRVGSMLNQLLDLARFDAPVSEGLAEDVDLTEILRECVAEQIELADIRKVDLGLGEIHSAVVRLVRADLALLLANVVDNAIRYTPAGGRVDCSLVRLAREAALISIEDTGPGVPPEHLSRLMERFYRGASVDTGGSGLGLAIALAAAKRNGLVLEITNRRDRSGLTVTIAAPVA